MRWGTYKKNRQQTKYLSEIVATIQQIDLFLNFEAMFMKLCRWNCDWSQGEKSNWSASIAARFIYQGRTIEDSKYHWIEVSWVLDFIAILF